MVTSFVWREKGKREGYFLSPNQGPWRCKNVIVTFKVWRLQVACWTLTARVKQNEGKNRADRLPEGVLTATSQFYKLHTIITCRCLKLQREPGICTEQNVPANYPIAILNKACWHQRLYNEEESIKDYTRRKRVSKTLLWPPLLAKLKWCKHVRQSN